MARMRVREAKDFLVQQTAEQAAIEGIPLSDLEKRMMYFVENEEMPEDPLKLNEEFEAQYDSDEYEAKISRLLRHAFARLKKEDPEAVRKWKEAIALLSKGDHYLPVMLPASSSAGRPPHDALKLFGTALLVVIIGLAVVFTIDWIADRYHIHWNGSQKSTHTSMPLWLQRLLIGSIVGGYIYYVVVPWITKKSPMGPGQLLLKVLRFALKDRRS